MDIKESFIFDCFALSGQAPARENILPSGTQLVQVTLSPSIRSYCTDFPAIIISLNILILLFTSQKNDVNSYQFVHPSVVERRC